MIFNKISSIWDEAWWKSDSFTTSSLYKINTTSTSYGSLNVGDYKDYYEIVPGIGTFQLVVTTEGMNSLSNTTYNYSFEIKIVDSLGRQVIASDIVGPDIYSDSITFTSRDYSTYYVEITNSFFGNFQYATTLNSVSSGGGGVSDTIAPSLSLITPADGATGIAVGANFVLTFNEAVKAGTGSFLVKSGTTTVATISVTDTSQVTFSGSTVTINPTSNLDYSKSYSVTVASGVIKDSAGNSWSGTGTNPYDFTTAPNTLNGSIGNDTLTGSTGVDLIYGNAGNDTLDGRTGADVMWGGAGNDTYYVDNASDQTNEAISATNTADAGGTDLVYSSVTLTLNDYLENLTLTGNDPINGIGNTLANILTGNSAVNTLNGGAGNDTLDGGVGADVMWGGAGNDIYYVDNANDQTNEAISATDTTGTDLVYSLVTRTLGDYLENLTLSGTDAINGIGNSIANMLIGNPAANTLTGDGGNDTLDGGAGNDTLDGGAGNDSLIGGDGTDTASYASATAAVTVNLALTVAQNTVGAGTDTLSSIENLTGSGFNDILTGSISANTINGGAGNDMINGGQDDDTLDGGVGNDSLIGGDGTDTASYASATAAVTVSLALTAAQNTVGAGTDTLSSIENLTGSGFDDTLTGSSLANTINGGAGNDMINGGQGDDTLDGGAANDRLIGGDGTDTASYASATAAVTVSLALTAAQNTVSAGTDTLSFIENLTGSSFNDILTGNAAFNTIDGGAGDDIMMGGAGNDTYFVNSTSDRVYETTTTSISSTTNAGGTDSIFSTVSLSLDDYNGVRFVENLTLQGISSNYGYGNSLNNSIRGNSAANTLSGGAGNDILDGGLGIDILTGGTGFDYFDFTSILNGTTNVDTITDFNRADDIIRLDNEVMAGLGTTPGALTAAAFVSGTGLITARDSSDRIIYNTTTGDLYYDSDGTGSLAAIKIALIGTSSSRPVLDHTDFLII